MMIVALWVILILIFALIISLSSGIEDENRRTILILILIIFSVIIIKVMCTAENRNGQISALVGKETIKIEVFPDSTRDWVEKEEKVGE